MHEGESEKCRGRKKKGKIDRKVKIWAENRRKRVNSYWKTNYIIFHIILYITMTPQVAAAFHNCVFNYFDSMSSTCCRAVTNLHRRPLYFWPVIDLFGAFLHHYEHNQFSAALSALPSSPSLCWLPAYLHFKQRRPQDVFQGNGVDHYGHLWGRHLVWTHTHPVN